MSIPNKKATTKSRDWVWKVYYLAFLFLTLFNTLYFFNSQSPEFLFYQLLIAFDLKFIVIYGFNAISIILNALTLVPYYFFLYHNHYFSPQFLRWFLLFRLTFDLTGRHYEILFIKSFTYQDSTTYLLFIATVLLVSIPSYLALWMDGFKKNPSETY